MLNQYIKENTKEAHQKLESVVVRQLKAIQNEADYARVLTHFYNYFNRLEEAIKPFITAEVLPDYAERRNSGHIKADILALGGTVGDTENIEVPHIHNTLEALSALYVLEGSIMGGPYIVQMLNKMGIHNGTSFFSGYGEQTGQMWGKFTTVLNAYGDNPQTHDHALAIANETFSRFGDVFALENVK